MRIGTTSLTTALVVLLLGGVASAQRGPSVGDLRVIYMDGLPYADAAKYTSEDSDALIDMLKKGDDAPYWPNAAAVLGIIGDDCSVDPLIDFVEGREGYDVEWSPTVYRGRLSGITGLGYLAGKRGNKKAMGYLLESVDPEIWIDRKIQWLKAREDEAGRWSLQLSAEAVLALRLTGQDAAGKELAALAADEGVHERLQRLALSAQSDWKAIKDRGLAAFYGAESTPQLLARAPSTPNGCDR